MISLVSLKAKKKKNSRRIPFLLIHHYLTFLFIPKPAIKTTILTQGRGDFEQALNFNFMRERYQMSQLILKLSAL